MHLNHSYYYLGFVPAKAPSNQPPMANGQQHPHCHGRHHQKWPPSTTYKAKNPAMMRLIDGGRCPKQANMLFPSNEAGLKPSKHSNGEARFITIIAAPPEHFKGFRLAHCQRKAYPLAWGIVPNQSNAYAPKIGLHMQH